MLLTLNTEEDRLIYNTDLETHVTPEMRKACPTILDLLTSELADDVFVPRKWTVSSYCAALSLLYICMI